MYNIKTPKTLSTVWLINYDVRTSSTQSRNIEEFKDAAENIWVELIAIFVKE